ncbi:MAG: LysM peptidoglycan-binding domain-containing protein [Bacteroidia bacterium]|jgi:membrane-bound lytic murein transglycosylase D|nr:LysM peptidoglycan-binding domain-containing protein [Bacteroidia bacterium]
MMRKKLLVFYLILSWITAIYAQSEFEEMEPDTSNFIVGDTVINISDSFIEEQAKVIFLDESPIVRMLDSLYRIRYFNDSLHWVDPASLNKYGYAPNEVPVFSDSIYRARIEALNRQTPIPLTYNQHIRGFIDLYAVRKRGLTSRMLGLSYVYFPMFEEMLDRYNIPLEMKYLAMVESALNPTAGSPMGAKGLWQFMYGTGKVYGLKVTSLVDDRFDPLKSTEAACQHMVDLYNIYEDWLLVMAAYNAGAGNVNRAIRRAGGVKDYWAIWPYLPRETRGYVPAFIAVAYVINHASEHNLYPAHPGMMMYGTDTVTVRDLISFEQLNELLGVPMADLRFFNPQFKQGIIPATPDQPHILRIPSQYVGAFLDNEKELYAYVTRRGVKQQTLIEEVKKVSEQRTHTVKSGETLGSIAKKYGVTVKQLQTWNHLKSTNLKIGQRLAIYTSGAPASSPGEAPVARATRTTTHTVQKGETLGSLANKYKCSVTDLKEWNNLKSTSLQVGQKLRVYPPEQAQASTVKSNGKVVYYTVKQGDTLWDIARRFDGVTVEQIKKLNNLGVNARIVPGQRLKISSVT